MVSVPVLILPNFEQRFEVETDVSGYDIRAVLSPKGRPIAFFSHALSARDRAKPVYERELIAVVLSVQRWRPYLLGQPFVVKTDQKALKFLLEQRVIQPQHQKWLSKLLGYNFEVHYRPGKENSVADALSRAPELKELTMVTQIPAINLETVKLEVEQDEDLKKIRADIQEGKQGDHRFNVKQGILMFKDRLVVSKDSSLIPTIMQTYHDSAIGGHSGFLRTYKRLSGELYWAGMKNTVKKYVEACPTCQQNKALSLTPAGLLTPLGIPDAIWEEISMDFVEGLPKSNGRNTIIVVVDRLSKYAHFMGLQHPFTAKTVADSFVQNVVKLHGFPKSIVSDRDKIFLSKFWRELFLLAGTKLHYSSAYHPQTDGQTEVVNRGLETYLRCFCGERPKQWEAWLPWAEYWYNTTYNSSIKTTPFHMVYGRQPPRLVHYERNKTPISALDQQLIERDTIIGVLRENIRTAQEQMKKYADKGRRDVQFQVNDWVYLRIRPYRQLTLRGKRNQKLSPKFFGPYQILEKIGAVAYRLQLPNDATIHPVFHVSQLRPAVGKPPLLQTHSPQLGEAFEWINEPSEVLGYRHNHATGEGEVLIGWKELPQSEATWEAVEDIQTRFPAFHLEDKVSLEDGSNVRPPITIHYSRRGKKRETGEGSKGNVPCGT